MEIEMEMDDELLDYLEHIDNRYGHAYYYDFAYEDETAAFHMWDNFCPNSKDIKKEYYSGVGRYSASNSPNIDFQNDVEEWLEKTYEEWKDAQ